VSGQLYPPYPPVDHPAAVAKLFVEVDVLGGVRQPFGAAIPNRLHEEGGGVQCLRGSVIITRETIRIYMRRVALCCRIW